MTSLSDLSTMNVKKMKNKVVFEKFLKKLNFLVDSFLF